MTRDDESLNDVAGGFIDKTEVICPRALDIVGGLIITGHGYCTMTDRDGDKAFVAWEQGKDTSPGTGGGTLKWTGGTGKYSGLQGNNTFRYTGIGKTEAFVVDWKGEWRPAITAVPATLLGRPGGGRDRFPPSMPASPV